MGTAEKQPFMCPYLGDVVCTGVDCRTVVDIDPDRINDAEEQGLFVVSSGWLKGQLARQQESAPTALVFMCNAAIDAKPELLATLEQFKNPVTK